MADINHLALNCYVQVINLNITFVTFAFANSVKCNITVKVNIESSNQVMITWSKIWKELPEVFFKEDALKSFAKITEKHLCCQFLKTHFYRKPLMAASVKTENFSSSYKYHQYIIVLYLPPSAKFSIISLRQYEVSLQWDKYGG